MLVWTNPIRLSGKPRSLRSTLLASRGGSGGAALSLIEVGGCIHSCTFSKFLRVNMHLWSGGCLGALLCTDCVGFCGELYLRERSMARALGGRVHYTVQPCSLHNGSAAPARPALWSSGHFNSPCCFLTLINFNLSASKIYGRGVNFTPILGFVFCFLFLLK